MKNLLLFVIISLSTNSFGQIDFENNSVQVKPNWELNKTYQYDFNDRNISISVNDTILDSKNYSQKKLIILDKNNYAYKLELVNGRNVSTDPDEFYRDFINQSEGIKYQFTTNLSGEFLELLNVKNIEKSFLTVIEKLTKQKKRQKSINEI